MRIKLVMVAVMAMTGSAWGTTWTVDDDLADLPSADFTAIQPAIDAAANGDVVLVYPGFYSGAIDFLGKAIVVESVDAIQTTIDGSETSLSVVTFSSGEGAGSVLDGFRIGHGSGTIIVDPIFGAVPCGGGIFVRDSSPTIRNCLITSNVCWGGAGLFSQRASARIEGCTFLGNVSEGHGGGIYNLESSSPTIINCRFEGNSASWGGGMTNTIDCDPTITDCVFEGNMIMNVGGGIFNRSRSSPTVTGCSFISNTQTGNPLGSGGGICNYGVGNGGGPCYPIVTNCLFEENVVNGDGAGMSNAYDCHPDVIDCTFRNNHAGRNGGGLACPGNLDPYFPSNAKLMNCLFEGNMADEFGGGFHSRASEPSVDSCDFRDNIAGLGGGGAGFMDSPHATVANSSFCGNSPGDFDGAYTDLGGNTSQVECLDCPGDIDGDGEVGVDDVLAMISAWGLCGGCPEDLDGDGVVDVDDLLALLAVYGPC